MKLSPARRSEIARKAARMAGTVGVSKSAVSQETIERWES